jgi:hypothetical protein
MPEEHVNSITPTQLGSVHPCSLDSGQHNTGIYNPLSGKQQNLLSRFFFFRFICVALTKETK